MHLTNAISLLTAAGLVSAAAVPRALGEHDIIIFGNGRMEVWNKTSYNLLSAPHNPIFNLTSPPPTGTFNGTFGHHHNGTMGDHNRTEVAVSKRCSKETIWHLDPVSTFLNWDVIMSSVVNAGANDATVAVTSGYSITNSLGVSSTTELSLVKDFLSTSFTIDYEQSWQSSYSAGYTFTVPAGKYGAVVSNPMTTRHSGSVDVGCVGAAVTSTFQSDSYSSKSYGDLAWVTGTISLCTSDSYPMKMCNGDGTLS